MTPTKLATIALGLAALGIAYLFRDNAVVSTALVGVSGTLLVLSGPEVGKVK